MGNAASKTTLNVKAWVCLLVFHVPLCYIFAVASGHQVVFFLLRYKVIMPTVIGNGHQGLIVLFVFGKRIVCQFVNVAASWLRLKESKQSVCQGSPAVIGIVNDVIGWCSEQEQFDSCCALSSCTRTGCGNTKDFDSRAGF